MISLSTDNASGRPPDRPRNREPRDREYIKLTGERFTAFRDCMRSMLGFYPHEAVSSAIKLNICTRNEWEYRRLVDEIMDRS